MFVAITAYLQKISSRLFKQFLELLISPAVHLGVLVCGCGFVIWGGGQLALSSRQVPQECPACPASESFRCLVGSQADEKVSSASAVVTIDIAGAVKRPGVYELQKGARLSDAITSAGGFSNDADLAAIAKNLNLATRLQPDAKMYIPKLNDVVTVTPSTIRVTEGAEASVVRLVDINSASQTELEELPAVGAVTAGKIIAGRPYTKIEELVAREIVTESTYGKIQALIAVY